MKITWALAVVSVVMMGISWAATDVRPISNRYNLAKFEKEQRDAAWQRLCKRYHATRDDHVGVANIDMDIMCFKFREMKP
jgi:hypothetical protein